MQRKVKHQVFISSTYKDLQEERWAVLRSLLSMDCIVSGMELFPAIDMEQFAYIKQIIDDCDYYVLILGGRYGSESPEGLSYTEMEYDYACSKGIPVIALVYDKPDELPVNNRETDPDALHKFRLFRVKAAGTRLVRFWSDIKDLQLLAIQAFHHAEKNFPSVGWVRGNTIASEEILSDLNTVRKENEQLRNDLAELRDRLDPKIPGLAPISADFDIQYSYWNMKDEINIKKTTLKKVFLLLYNQFREGISKDDLGDVLRRYLPRASDGDFTFASQQSLNLIINQLTAHNLITRQYEDSDEYGFRPIYILTDRGCQYGLEEVVLKEQ